MNLNRTISFLLLMSIVIRKVLFKNLKTSGTMLFALDGEKGLYVFDVKSPS
jgi:hypothetical protein